MENEFVICYDYRLIEQEELDFNQEYGMGDTSEIDESRRLTIYSNGGYLNCED